MKFALFLDIDGVLNTRTTCERTPDYRTGIDEERVRILSKCLSNYEDYEVVLTSDWKDLRPEDDDYIYLCKKLQGCGIRLSGKTQDSLQNRGEGICNYLIEHKDIDDFVLLDDNTFDFADYKQLWERLLITNGIERARFASETPEVETIIFLDYIKTFS